MIGQTISHYHITAKLGSGGMGEVFLATDTKLDRNVALKFLPAHLSVQEDVKARFIQEAKAASALNHPNICTIHDIAQDNGRLFIVMEYIEGQTLREKRGTLSVKQTIEIGIQVADGLAAAHEKGIVHRDIKSENVMLRKDGIVQIMDFGLAKLRGVSRLTKEGSTLGTVGYMSPEQAQGQETDHRTDLFSLGVVLYELLTGEMPFRGEHEAAILYEIVNVEAAPPSSVKPEIDPELDRIILDCLQKDPDERSQSAKEVARDLRRFKVDSGRRHVSRVSTIRRVSGLTSTPTEPIATKRPRSQMVPWMIAVLLFGALISVMILRSRPTGSPGTSTRFSFAPHAPYVLSQADAGMAIAVSPDGRSVAFVATDSTGRDQLWVRRLDAFESRPLPGTDYAYFPFWSPDSRFIGFFADGKLKKIDVNGAPPLVVCDAPQGRGGSWSRDGVIVFAPNSNVGLFRVSASGGVASAVTKLDSAAGESTHRLPWFLPDGDRFLYVARFGIALGQGVAQVMIGSLDSSVNRALMENTTAVSYARGQLFFVRENTLLAQPFDPKANSVSGEPVRVGDGVVVNVRYAIAGFSVSDDGVVVYRSAESQAVTAAVWFDREGHPLDTVAKGAWYSNCRLAPDGRQLALEKKDPRSDWIDVWTVDMERRIETRFTFAEANEGTPVWSPDGRWIVYSGLQGDSSGLFVKPASGEAAERLLVASSVFRLVNDWSSDGRYVLFMGPERVGQSGDDLWYVSVADGRAQSEPIAFLKRDFDEDDARFSPDGRWIAHGSDESGVFQIYVRPFPGPGGRWQISSEGGDYPVWRRDGKELFYLAPDLRLMAVEVDGTGTAFKVGQVRPLFRTAATSLVSPYDVSADGQQFLIITAPSSQEGASIRVIMNWDAESAAQ